MWAIPTIAVAVLAFAAVSHRLDGSPLTAPLVFTTVGLLFGSKAFDLVDPHPAQHAVKVLAEATLTLTLFGDAARIDLKHLRDEFSLPARLLGIGLPLTIGLGFLAALALFRSLGLAGGARSWRSSSPPPTRRSGRPSSRSRACPPGSARR